ncbi:MAG: biotin/lipoyl-containing protein, partial [Geobacteraceae bacterium]
MATEITMPKLSDTMTEGRLVAWMKGVGDRVERGDIVALVETDKANMELESFAAGVLLETRVNPGELAPVGAVI